MRWLILLLPIAVIGCTTPQPAATAVLCPPLVSYTPEEEKATGDALAALAGSNELVVFMSDYGRMRAADRACLSAKP